MSSDAAAASAAAATRPPASPPMMGSSWEYGDDHEAWVANAMVALSEELLPIFVLCVAIFLASVVSKKYIFWPLGKYFGLDKKDPSLRKMRKFCDESWSLAWHVFSLAWEFHCAIHEKWFYASVSPWTAPGGTEVFWSQKPVRMSLSLRYLMLVQMSYYLQNIVHFVFLPPKDTTAMVSHHIAAFCLIIISYFPPPCEFVYIGAGILLLHEVSDVFLYGAKILHYLGADLLTNVVFLSCIVSWFYLRLFNFPRIIYSAAAEAPRRSLRLDVAVVFLCVLYVLHIYWFKRIVGILIKSLKSKEGLKEPEDYAIARGESVEDLKKTKNKKEATDPLKSFGDDDATVNSDGTVSATLIKKDQ